MNKIVREIKLTKILGDDKLSGDAKKFINFFENVFNGLVQEVSEDKPHHLHFYKMVEGRLIIYIQEDSINKITWCSYQRVWSFFEEEFNYNYQEIKELTHAMLEMHLKRKVFPTKAYWWIRMC